ncbi:MAG TPA: ribosome biogenesis GTPase Der [Dehalococcoidia bacterium]|nr:ribosome biogenesis GTPase Der [Dehalococcoidia bacterium]
MATTETDAATDVAVRKPVVAIVGRPNVGKSTLFNRLIGGRRAIVEDIPGTTRDRLYGDTEWKDHAYSVIDTGGLEPDATEGYSVLIREQVAVAVAEADVILFIVDTITGVTPVDEEIAELLRRNQKPVLVLANKGDNPERQELAVEFYELGLGEPTPISAHHDIGIREVQDALIELLPAIAADAETRILNIAVVGRPNVGKSLLVNAILGEERVIVSEMAGTTRDAVDTPFEYKGRQMLLIDTAGIRRPGRIERGIEKYSVMRAMEAVERSDVVILVLDGTEKVAHQDQTLAGEIAKAYKGLVVAVNKWDLSEDTEEWRDTIAHRVLTRLRFTPWAPMAFISAKTRLNIDGLLDLVAEVHDTRATRIPTAEVNSVLREAVAEHPPASSGRKTLRLKYATQADINPPTFVVFCNDASMVHFSYRRYLENAFRRAWGFEGTAIKIEYRSRAE